MRIDFFPVADVRSNEFREAMNIYFECFPMHEQQTEQTIIERVQQGRNQMHAGRIGNEIVFMSLLWPLRGTEFILLDYLATSARHRGKNIASMFLTELRKLQQYFLLEVEDPAYGDNAVQRQKRIGFYLKNGARILKDVNYLLPPVQGDKSTEMLLMIFPEYRSGTISKQLVQLLIDKVYKELYNTDGGPLPDSLPDQIGFIP